MTNEDNTRRVIGLALTLWGSAVALASVEGVLAKLSQEELAALALFAFACASATYLLDRSLRAFAHAASGFAGTLVLLDVALAVTARAACATSEPWSQTLTTPVFAVAAFFFAPLLVVLHLAAVDRALHERPSPEPSAIG
jgi:hypothetical protein